MQSCYADIGFTPEYSELFKDTAFGGEPCHYAGYLFYKRPIPETHYFDIVSPYGYGGHTEESAKRLNSFHVWCEQENIVSEFARLHPFIENHWYLPQENVVQSGEVYYVDLTKPFEFDKGCKSAIKKQERLKCDWYRGHHIPPFFANVYNQMLRKHQASEAYYFSPEFWQTIGEMGYYMEYNQGGAVLLAHGDYCHYFLAAGGSQNIIISEAISWAKSQGCKIFNLGGGVNPNDSLASFKRSFSRLAKPFFTYRKIHNQSVYNELCQAKGVDGSDITQFFPAYRR